VGLGLQSLGDVLVAQGEQAAALADYREALAIMRALAQADPTNADFPHSIAALTRKLTPAMPDAGPKTDPTKP